MKYPHQFIERITSNQNVCLHESAFLTDHPDDQRFETVDFFQRELPNLTETFGLNLS